MAKMGVVDESPFRCELIPLNQIELGDLNVRKDVLPEALSELKDSVQALGLLQPVVVMKQEGKRRPFKLIIGQRRYRAYEELGREDVPARVLEPTDERTAVALSLAENMQREELSYADTARAVSTLYGLFGDSDRAVAKATGMSLTMVRRLLSIEKFASKKTKQWIHDRHVSRMDVKRALEATQYDPDKAEKLVEKMRELPGLAKRNLSRYAAKHPGVAVEALVAKAQQPAISHKLLVDLSEEVRRGLEKAQKSLQKEAADIAAQALEEWLQGRGFM